MASYFDEHDCEPLKDGEQPNHQLHLVRLLLDGGWTDELSEMFNSEKPPPPASKKVVAELPTKKVTAAEAEKEKNCPVCLLEYEEKEQTRVMPCKHDFHPDCLLPWLEKTNSCPVCRHELPTDDEHYEQMKKQKARQKQRDYELESLHNSMFG